jgi:hypothetical protein
MKRLVKLLAASLSLYDQNTGEKGYYFMLAGLRHVLAHLKVIFEI